MLEREQMQILKEICRGRGGTLVGEPSQGISIEEAQELVAFLIEEIEARLRVLRYRVGHKDPIPFMGSEWFNEENNVEGAGV